MDNEVDEDATSVARMQVGDDSNLKSRLQQYFLENHKASLRVRSLNFLVKLLTCILYSVQVVLNDGNLPDKKIERPFANEDSMRALVWTNRTPTIWLLQTSVAAISIFCTCFCYYITYRGSLLQIFTYSGFLWELLTSVPLLMSIFVPILQDLNVLIFFNCWIANKVLQEMLHDIHRVSNVRQSVLSREIIALCSTLMCLIFTGACGMEVLQRSGQQNFDLFTALYFVVATFSTVGFGDVFADTWISRLWVMLLIIFSICILPKKLESLGQAVSEKEKAEFNNTSGFNQATKHIVCTIPFLDSNFIHDFLSEFYAHKKHQGIIVALLSPCDLDVGMRNLLRIPMWSDRVCFYRGTALRDEDLDRVNMSTARACFILSARNVQQKKESDHQTILRSWAVKDYAPDVPQYVQVFLAETKMHLEHTELVICEDEFKYSLLANNCICPGISTFITLLMHTSQGEEGQKSNESWHRTYGFHSGNEIYDIAVKDSRFFGEYVGKTFTYASFHAHRTYGICLVGVKRDDRTDTYMWCKAAITNMASTIANIGSVAFELPQELSVEEDKSKWKKRRRLLRKSKNLTTSDAESLMKVNRKQTNGERKSSIAAVTGNLPSSSSDEDVDCQLCTGITCIADQVKRDLPPVGAYVSANSTLCHLLKEKRPICCLQLNEPCQHCSYRTANQYGFRNRLIIVAADKSSTGLYNLLLPLRSFHRPVHDLNPIILLLQLENKSTPNDLFLEIVSHFPEVYWMRGKISNLDNLLKAGVNQADHVIVVKEASVGNEVQLADCETIITVQKIHKMFPKLKITTELITETNMRFMEFDASDEFALQQSKFEKKERKRGSTLAFMFRLPFASGSVFSAHMLDRLLYQSFLKPYLHQFLKTLLGIDNTLNSGYLASLQITEDDVWIRTYGRLYQKLCSSVADIPIGIYRTTASPSKQAVAIEVEDLDEEGNPLEELRERRLRFHRNSECHVHEMVKQRMQSFHLNVQQYNQSLDEKKRNISYVIINPSFDLELQAGDIIYVLRPPLAESAKHKRTDPRFGLRRRSESKSADPPTNAYRKNS
ncbi:Calcium-activated BK potassium channel alpha subunit [Aphelenchoides bicaudatus]|nr:Calcium-activated BK potassium channel alpha subunit [Aphelenchoides bicaudatus]